MKRSGSKRAFTLIELMVATAILLGLATIMISITGEVSKVFKRTAGKVEQFGEARRAYENVTRRLSEATLNTYWDYAYKTTGSSRVPSGYMRQSELRFRSGPMKSLLASDGMYRPTHGLFFQAPAGWVEEREELSRLDQSLNTWGFFLEAGDDHEYRPAFLEGRVPKRLRSRLLELREPAERLSIYAPPDKESANWWFATSLERKAGRPVRVLAENIIALVVLPRLSRPDELARGDKPPLSPNYDYDSTRTSNHQPALFPADPEINPKNQLPPVVQVVMVALDETSGARLAQEHGEEEDLGVRTEDLFQKSLWLEDNPDSYAPGDGDLFELERRLIAQRLSYRIFSTNVALRGAKWSKAQTN
ncbi:MAG: Verru_Chthon cassette protein C [Verrucomicrobiota bacterium]